MRFAADNFMVFVPGYLTIYRQSNMFIYHSNNSSQSHMVAGRRFVQMFKTRGDEHAHLPYDNLHATV